MKSSIKPAKIDPQVERALIQDLKAGLPQAVTCWFELYKPHITSFISTKINSAHQVDELTQEVFVHSLRQLPLFRQESALLTWMLSIARHEVADYYRKKYAKKALKTIPLMDWLFVTDFHDAHETAALVREILAKMTPRYRVVLLKKYGDEMSIKEIAVDIEKSEKSVESDLYRARVEFKALWDQHAHIYI